MPFWNQQHEGFMTPLDVLHTAQTQGLDFATFLERAHQRKDANDPADPYAQGRPLNYSRMTRHQATYVPTEAMTTAMNTITEPQTWVVITEDWCGDSAQTLPVIAAIAALNPLVELRILDRDTYPEAMDLYLTNGSRSVPMVIAFGSSASPEQLWVWGPRPEAAKLEVATWKTQFAVNTEWYPLLHAWYVKHGHQEVEADFIQRIKGT